MKKVKKVIGRKYWLQGIEKVRPIRKHKKISNRALSKEDLASQIENLVYSITKLRVKVPKFPTGKKMVEKRKYSFRIQNLHNIPRKYLTGIHGRLVVIARKEGLLAN